MPSFDVVFKLITYSTTVLQGGGGGNFTHIHNVKLTHNTSNYSHYSKRVIYAQPTLQYSTFPQLANYPCAICLCLSDFKFHYNALIFST